MSNSLTHMCRVSA